MSDPIGRIIALILVVAMLAIGPTLYNSLEDDNVMKKGLMNTAYNFVDTVADNATISEEDLENLYIDCASYGVAVDVTVRRKLRVVNPDGLGGTRVYYMVDNNINNYNKGDMVEIEIKVLSYTTNQTISSRVLGLIKPKFNCKFSARVRK